MEHDPDMGGEEIDVTPLRIPKRTKPVENLEKMLEDFVQKNQVRAERQLLEEQQFLEERPGVGYPLSKTETPPLEEVQDFEVTPPFLDCRKGST